MSTIIRFARDESGATAIEYALIAILLSVVIVVGATAVGSQLNIILSDISTDLGG
jgi:pilus assembly protein Flp/PilA